MKLVFKDKMQLALLDFNLSRHMAATDSDSYRDVVVPRGIIIVVEQDDPSKRTVLVDGIRWRVDPVLNCCIDNL